MTYTKAPPMKGILLILTLLLALSVSTPPHDDADRRPAANPPAAEEIALLEELAQWVGYENEGEDVLATGSLGEIIRARSTSFDVFRLRHSDRSSSPLSGLPFGHEIRLVAERYDIDALLIAAIVEVESGFNPTAVSGKGATGLMQLMPGNIAEEGRDQLTDPRFNLTHGVRYLSQLLRQYEGDLELTLAAYNAGPGNVRKFGGLPPFRETRQFVDRVLGIYIGHHRGLWQASEEREMLASAEQASALVREFRG